MKDDIHEYQATIKSVYDGDTITADIDLGMDTILANQKLRLRRIVAPEMHGSERLAAEKSRDFLRQFVRDNKVIVQVFKDKKGKYGRYSAELWIQNADQERVNINDLMVEKGYAEFENYD